MRPATFPMRARLLALAFVCALSPACATRQPAVALNPPTDLFAREPRPEPPADALESEAAYEAWVSALDAWGRSTARRMDAACRWMRDAGVKVECPAGSD